MKLVKVCWVRKWKLLTDNRAKKLWSRRAPTSTISLFSTTLWLSQWIPTAVSSGTAELRSPATKSKPSVTLPRFSSNSLLLPTTLLTFILKYCFLVSLYFSLNFRVSSTLWIFFPLCCLRSGLALKTGFINTHVHTSQQLARSIADDVDLMTWLHHRIWPYESTMTEEDSYVSSLLCGIELIHSGVSIFISAFTSLFFLIIFCCNSGN